MTDKEIQDLYIEYKKSKSDFVIQRLAYSKTNG